VVRDAKADFRFQLLNQVMTQIAIRFLSLMVAFPVPMVLNTISPLDVAYQSQYVLIVVVTILQGLLSVMIRLYKSNIVLVAEKRQLGKIAAGAISPYPF